MDKELLNYVSRARGLGILDEEIRDALLEASWSLEEVNQALKEAGSHLPIINSIPTKEDSYLEWNHVHKKIFIIIILFISFVVIGFVGTLAYKTYQQSRSPESLTLEILKSSSQVTSFDYKGSLELGLDYQSKVSGNSTSSVLLPDVTVNERSTTTAVFEGSVSAPIGGRPKISLSGDVDIVDLNKEDFKVDLDLKLIEDVLYLFVADIGQWELLDLKSLVGGWLSVTPADTTLLGLAFDLTAPSVNQLISWRNAIVRSKSFQLVRKVKTEEINGVDLAVYDFALDLNQSDYLFDDVLGDLEVVADEGVVFGQVWINKSDGLIYRLSISSNFTDNHQPEEKAGYFDLRLDFSNFNTDIAVDKPSESKPIFEILNGILNASSSTATST